LVYFGPEALFECFFGIFEGCGFFDEVEVGEDANDFGEAVRLEDVEEFKTFLLINDVCWTRKMMHEEDGKFNGPFRIQTNHLP
jgi:hypothetical protein